MLAIYAIIAITVLVSVRAFSDSALLYRYALIPSSIFQGKQWHRLFTHMLVHGGWLHLLVNMFVFYSFASHVLYIFSSLRGNGITPFPSWMHLVMLYVMGGLSAATCSCLAHRNNSAYMSVGASGAVSAVLFCSIFFSPWAPLYFFGVLPLPGILFAVLYVVYSYWMGKRGGDGIDHWAHLGGGVFGVIYPVMLDPHLLSHFFRALVNPSWL